jgi:hypothetical protein
MGQVIGQSDKIASRPATEPYGPRHLLATVMETLLDVGQVRIRPEVPRGVAQVISDGQPIPGLL